MKYNVKEILGERILIKQERTKKIGSIFIAEDNQEKQQVATVLQIGNDVEKIEIGDRVLFDKFAESVLDEDDNGVYSFITESDVIAIVGD